MAEHAVVRGGVLDESVTYAQIHALLSEVDARAAAALDLIIRIDPEHDETFTRAMGLVHERKGVQT